MKNPELNIFYLAGRYGRRAELKVYADHLETLGYESTATWLAGGHESEGERSTSDEESEWAECDLADITYADIFVAFTEPENTTHSRGGRHVELGYALARSRDCGDLKVLIVGPAENVFCNLSGIMRFDTVEELFEHLEGLPK